MVAWHKLPTTFWLPDGNNQSMDETQAWSYIYGRQPPIQEINTQLRRMEYDSQLNHMLPYNRLCIPDYQTISLTQLDGKRGPARPPELSKKLWLLVKHVFKHWWPDPALMYQDNLSVLHTLDLGSGHWSTWFAEYGSYQSSSHWGWQDHTWAVRCSRCKAESL